MFSAALADMAAPFEGERFAEGSISSTRSNGEERVEACALLYAERASAPLSFVPQLIEKRHNGELDYG